MTLAGLAVDALGNRTTPGDEYPRSTVTSTTASDGVVWDPDWSANTVTFSEPGTRTLTVSEGGVSTSFTVRVSEAPAPVAGITIGVLPADGTSGDRWGVEGDVITYYPADGDAQQVDAIPARQGARVQIRALAVDADGQPVGDHTDLAFTSDVASDRIEYDPDAAATWVTFEHASPHTITVASGDVTSTIRFEVQPTATTTVTTTHTPTASGTLAYTGADESGPLAWASACWHRAPACSSGACVADSAEARHGDRLTDRRRGAGLPRASSPSSRVPVESRMGAGHCAPRARGRGGRGLRARHPWAAGGGSLFGGPVRVRLGRRAGPGAGRDQSVTEGSSGLLPTGHSLSRGR